MVFYLSGFYQTKHHAKAIAGFMLAIPGANALGSPLSTFLLGIDWLDMSGWQWLFIIEAIPALILGVIAFFLPDDKIEDVNGLIKMKAVAYSYHNKRKIRKRTGKALHLCSSFKRSGCVNSICQLFLLDGWILRH